MHASRKLLWLVFCVVGLTVGASPAFSHATSFTENVKIPFSMAVYVPCALDGTGEDVMLEGYLHVRSHYTINKNKVQISSQANPQHLSGYGVTSQDKYQATGITHEILSQDFNGYPIEYTYGNNFRIIGQGNGNNFLIHENIHVTVNANGEVTADVSNVKAECK